MFLRNENIITSSWNSLVDFKIGIIQTEAQECLFWDVNCLAARHSASAHSFLCNGNVLDLVFHFPPLFPQLFSVPIHSLHWTSLITYILLVEELTLQKQRKNNFIFLQLLVKKFPFISFHVHLSTEFFCGYCKFSVGNKLFYSFCVFH